MILMVALGTACAEPWYRLYDQAKDDIDHQRWESAVDKLEQAVAQKADSGASVRSEGTKKIAYFPYFLMGKALYHLGRYDVAAKFFSQETQVGLPNRIATEIGVYQTYLRAIEAERARLAQFNALVGRAQTLRARGAFTEAVEVLRRARECHPAEFERLDLGRTVEQLQNAERARVQKKARRDREAAFLALTRPVARNQRGAVQVVSVPDFETVRRAVLAAYEGPPEQAIKMLEEVQRTSGTRNVELESSMGIAYARLGFLTVNPAESERFREKATQHFRLALALDPGHKLNARLVAPQIMDLFAASR